MGQGVVRYVRMGQGVDRPARMRGKIKGVVRPSVSSYSVVLWGLLPPSFLQQKKIINASGFLH